MSDHRAIFGLPISGEITPSYETEREQYPDDQLQEALFDVLAIPEIEAVQWRQYTPYWNDGEQCVFHALDILLKFAGDGDFVYEGDAPWPAYLGGWDYSSPANIRTALEGSLPPKAVAAVKRMKDAIAGGHHNKLLLAVFGDHAEVTADMSGFSVDFYEHE